MLHLRGERCDFEGAELVLAGRQDVREVVRWDATFSRSAYRDRPEHRVMNLDVGVVIAMNLPSHNVWGVVGAHAPDAEGASVALA